MVQVLTKEQSEVHEEFQTRLINDWFNTLNFEEKKIVYNHYKTIFKQIKCNHSGDKYLHFNDRHACSDCGYLLP